MWSPIVAQQLRRLRTRSKALTGQDLSACERALKNGARVALDGKRVSYRLICKGRWQQEQCQQRVPALLGTFAWAARQAGVNFPPVEFLLNAGDRPVIELGKRDGSCVVFSYDVNPMTHADVAIPMWGLLNDFSHYFEEVPWAKKNSTAFWRGSTTGGLYRKKGWWDMPRARLVRYCRERPAACDAAFTGFPQTGPGVAEAMIAELGQAPRVEERQLSRHKFLLLIDGNGAPASRSYRVLWSRSVVLWVRSSFSEFFYPLLQPWEHFVPIRPDLSDLANRVDWLAKNQGVARHIAESTYAFASQFLNGTSIAMYVAELMDGYQRHYKPPSSGVGGPGFTVLP